MPKQICCVSTCKADSTEPGITLIKFPADDILAQQWKAVCGLQPDFVIKPNTRICSQHFRSGKRSLNPNSEDYIPTVFEVAKSTPYPRKSYCNNCKKVTLTCPCKQNARKNSKQTEPEEEEEEGEDDENEDEEEEEEEDAEEEEEETMDDGEVVDSDDDEWTPAVVIEESKPRRSSRNSRKRRHSSSDSSENSEPPAAAPSEVKDEPKPKSPPKKNVPQENIKTEGTTSGRKRGRPPATPKSTPEVKNENPPKSTGSDQGKPVVATAAAPDSTSTPTTAEATPITQIPNARNKYILARTRTPVLPQVQNQRLQSEIQEMKMEHSMKLEKLQRNYNMIIANLKEENLQNVHKMKVEWELERANFQSQIEYYKEALNTNGGNFSESQEQPLNPFNGGQPIIILRPESEIIDDPDPDRI